MKTTEQLKIYREMDMAKLVKELETLETKINHDTLKVKASKLDDYSSINKTKKSIARVKTLISMSLEK